MIAGTFLAFSAELFTLHIWPRWLHLLVALSAVLTLWHLERRWKKQESTNSIPSHPCPIGPRWDSRQNAAAELRPLHPEVSANPGRATDWANNRMEAFRENYPNAVRGDWLESGEVNEEAFRWWRAKEQTRLGQD